MFSKTAQVPEALFYHLTAHPLERALPTLIERTLQKGWRAVVRAGSTERVEFLDNLLWTFRDESFIPHSRAGAGSAEQQPIYLTAGDEIPNEADVLFVVDGADTDDFTARDRTIVMFDGANDEAVAFAREQWKRAAAVVTSTYWKQDGSGRWEMAAESTPS